MKLIYRGQTYENATSVQFGAGSADATAQSKFKTLYRGQNYYATPPVVDQATATTRSTVTLNYRGIAYKRIFQSSQFHSQARTINW